MAYLVFKLEYQDLSETLLGLRDSSVKAMAAGQLLVGAGQCFGNKIRLILNGSFFSNF